MDSPGTMTQEDILRRLWTSFQAHQTVKMLNMFRGMPVSYDATIALISQEYAALTVHGYQAACIFLEKRAYLQSQVLPEVVQAHPISIDVPHGEVILNRFSITGLNFSRRMATRVQPKESVRVQIHTNEATIPGSLADLSVSGMGVYTFGAYVSEQMDLSRHEVVSLELTLPLVERRLELQGRVINVSRERFTLLSRCGIEIVIDPEAETILQEFISQRKSQVFQELEAVYQAICKTGKPG